MFIVTNMAEDNIKFKTDNKAEAICYIIYSYFTEEIPRLSKILSHDDLASVIAEDRATMFNGYINDYLKVEERAVV